MYNTCVRPPLHGGDGHLNECIHATIRFKNQLAVIPVNEEEMA